MGISSSDLTSEWECECQCCRYREKDDAIVLPTADGMDAAVAAKDQLAVVGSSVARCLWLDQHPWDSSAASAAIAKIGVANDKLGVSSRSTEVTTPSSRESPLDSLRMFNTVHFPIPPEYMAKVDLQPSTSKAAKRKHSSPCAPGALPAYTQVSTPKVQDFQPLTAEVCDERIWKTADGDAPFQACLRP